ncbi:MAG: hypothetical protein ACOX5Z_02255 [Desulfobulbus sp.]|jgi:hypothetical protein
MVKQKKKIAAALAAVNAYLMEEEAAQAAQFEIEPQIGPSLWAVSGRQNIMNFRNLIQYKAFNR